MGDSLITPAVDGTLLPHFVTRTGSSTVIKPSLASVATCLTLFAIANVSHAATSIGFVNMLEVWPSGNIAFTISGAGPCNGQFILNASSPGTKNIYAALLAAKHAKTSVRVEHTSCGTAEGYGGNYAYVDYLYVLD